jgi:N utilization substance protein B
MFLLLLTDIHEYAVKRIELGKNKKRPTHEDLFPNTKFIDNLFLKQLAVNKSLLKYVEQNKISWANHEDVIKNVFKAVVSSDLYKDYMENGENNEYEKDKKFVAKLFEKVIAPVEDLYAALEEMSIYWNDEAEFIISMVIKTIKTFDEQKGEDQELLPEFKDKEDKEFVKKLLRKSLVNGEKNRDLIKKYTRNWDFERVAFMDVVIMQVAIAELMEFQEIPARVTLNEYIEIAKHYSTGKSGVFINGIIDKIVEQMIKEGKIVDAEKKSVR